MKDKLVKTGHRKAYYRLRRGLKLGLLISVFALAFATPAIVAYSFAAQETQAQVNETKSDSEERGENAFPLESE